MFDSTLMKGGEMFPDEQSRRTALAPLIRYHLPFAALALVALRILTVHNLLFLTFPRIAANYCFHGSSLLTAVTETQV